MKTSEDRSVYDKVVNSIFEEEILSIKSQHQDIGGLGMGGDGSNKSQYADLDTELRDYVTEAAREVFKRHCAKHLEIVPMHLLDDSPQFSRLVNDQKNVFSSVKAG